MRAFRCGDVHANWLREHAKHECSGPVYPLQERSHFFPGLFAPDLFPQVFPATWKASGDVDGMICSPSTVAQVQHNSLGFNPVVVHDICRHRSIVSHDRVAGTVDSAMFLLLVVCATRKKEYTFFDRLISSGGLGSSNIQMR